MITWSVGVGLVDDENVCSLCDGRVRPGERVCQLCAEALQGGAEPAPVDPWEHAWPVGGVR